MPIVFEDSGVVPMTRKHDSHFSLNVKLCHAKPRRNRARGSGLERRHERFHLRGYVWKNCVNQQAGALSFVHLEEKKEKHLCQRIVLDTKQKQQKINKFFFEIFGYFDEFADRDAHIWRVMRKKEKNFFSSIPSVDSFGDFVAFQGPTELAALGISSLHYPCSPFH